MPLEDREECEMEMGRHAGNGRASTDSLAHRQLVSFTKSVNS